MNGRGSKTALLTATFVLAGCTAASNQFEVRAAGDPIAGLPAGDALAVARTQLALNNVGLALEAFRKVQRERPSDPAPLVGIADCYSAMGRFDLAQSNLEGALSLSPHDPALLRRFATVLQLEGQPDRAAQVRREAAAEVPTATSPLIAAAARVAPTSSVTIALPPARPAALAGARPGAARMNIPSVNPPSEAAAAGLAGVAHVATAKLQEVSAAVASARAPIPVVPANAIDSSKEIASSRRPPGQSGEAPIAGPQAKAGAAPVDQSMSTATDEPSLSARATVAQPRQPTPAPIGPSVQLAAAPPVQRVQLATAPPVQEVQLTAAPPVQRPIELSALLRLSNVAAAPFTQPHRSALAKEPPRPSRPANNVVPEEAIAPHLERISPKEVALVTAKRSPQAPGGRTAFISSVRWVALAQTSRANVVVLNAAGSNRLAASARLVLADRGWRRIAIGNAPAIRQASVVFYPHGKAKLAGSLAAQFGIHARMISGKSLVILLGRDKIGTIRALRQT